MPRFVIERDIPEIGSAEREALRDASRKSNGVLAEMRAEKKNIQCEHSYVQITRLSAFILLTMRQIIESMLSVAGFPLQQLPRCDECLIL